MTNCKIDAQELFVKDNYYKAYTAMSNYKTNGYNNYSPNQVKMKLREEYNSNKYSSQSDDYIIHSKWKNWNN